MTMNKGIIVSCQALPDEPLHSPFIMAKMAKAAQIGGAVGIRANSAIDIKAIQQEVDLPIIGIVKRDYDHLKSFITPTRKELDELLPLGIEVIAMDATINADPTMLAQIKDLKQQYPNTKFMADISTTAEGLQAHEYGFDYVGTTLVGYNEHSKGLSNFTVLQQLIEQSPLPVIAEGNFDTPEKCQQALTMGAHTVVVGSIITRPQLITKRFVDAIVDI